MEGQVAEFVDNYLLNDNWGSEDQRVKDACEALENPGSEFAIEFGKQIFQKEKEKYAQSNVPVIILKLLRSGCSLDLTIDGEGNSIIGGIIYMIYMEAESSEVEMSEEERIEVDNAVRDLVNISEIVLARKDLKLGDRTILEKFVKDNAKIIGDEHKTTKQPEISAVSSDVREVTDLQKQVAEFIQNYILSDQWKDDDQRVQVALKELGFTGPRVKFSPFVDEFYKQKQKAFADMGASDWMTKVINKLVKSGRSYDVLKTFSLLICSANILKSSDESAKNVLLSTWNILLGRYDVIKDLKLRNGHPLDKWVSLISGANPDCLSEEDENLRKLFQYALNMIKPGQTLDSDLDFPESQKLPTTTLPQAPTQQRQIDTDNGKMKAFLDKFILSFADAKTRDKSYVARINVVNKMSPDHLRDEVLAKLFQVPKIKQQIKGATPEELEQFANGVMRFFADVKVSDNHPRGSKFTSNKNFLLNPIQWVVDLFVNLWAAIKSGSMDPLKSFISNRAHGIIWDISAFEDLASKAASGTLTGISPEEAVKAKKNFEDIFVSKQTQI